MIILFVMVLIHTTFKFDLLLLILLIAFTVFVFSNHYSNDLYLHSIVAVAFMVAHFLCSTNTPILYK